MSESKLQSWGIYGAIAFVALACYWLKKHSTPESMQVEPQAFSYEMPRPSSYSADFDISGRPIIRKIEKVGGHVHSNQPAVPALKAPPAAQAGAVSAPALAAKTAANRQAEAQKKATAADQARKNNSSVRITEGRPDSSMGRLADASNSGSSSGSSPAASAPYYDPNANVQQTATAASTTDDSPKLSDSDWLSLLKSSPTSTNASQFLAAYKKKDVSSSSFYKIANELLADGNKGVATLGLNLLQQTPSLTSFSMLVDSSGQIQDATLKTQATAAIASYGKASGFAVLNQALSSSDMQVLSTAMQLIGSALSSMESSQGQNGGSSSGSGATAQQFQTFATSLTKLVSSSDMNVASQARALLASIQAVSPV